MKSEPTTCRVRMFRLPQVNPGPPLGPQHQLCGQPVVADGLCSQHLADKERLSKVGAA